MKVKFKEDLLMPQKLESVDVDVANCYLKMAADVALGTISERDTFHGAIGAVVVQTGDVLGEGQCHLKHGEELNANCKSIGKAEQRAVMAAMANVEDKDQLKGATVYFAGIGSDKSVVNFEKEDFFKKVSQTSAKSGIAWWVMAYPDMIYRYTRREMLR